MSSYIPSDDGAFEDWADRFLTTVQNNEVELGLEPDSTQPVVEMLWDFNTAFAQFKSARTAYDVKREAKEAKRAALESEIRALAARLQASPAVSDEERALLTLPVPDREPTPAAEPDSAPALAVKASQRLLAEVSFRNPGSQSKGRPGGVMGCEVWLKIGDPAPADLDECEYLDLATRCPYTVHFAGWDAGKTAHFLGRWVSTRGAKGPLSETASVTVMG